MHTFAQLTGQIWKIRILQIFAAGGLIVVIGNITIFWFGNPLGLPDNPLITGVPYWIFVPGFVWYAAAIRCPECRKSFVWYHLTHGKAFGFNKRIEASCVCPICGFDPSIISLTEKE